MSPMFPAEQHERIGRELLAIVEDVNADGITVQAYGVRISKPDRTEAARLKQVIAERDAADDDATAWRSILQHPALQSTGGDPSAVIARLDRLAVLEDRMTPPQAMSADTPSARDWAHADAEHRATAWAAMPLTELQRVGAMLKREHDDAQQVIGRLRGAREHLADLLHTAADDVDPSAPAIVSPIQQTGRYVP